MKGMRRVVVCLLGFVLMCVTVPSTHALTWMIIDVDTDSTIQSVSLALTSTGAPRIAYVNQGSVKYASCDASCTDPSQWSFLDLGVAPEGSGTTVSLALGPDDRPHVLISCDPGYGTPATYMYCVRDCSVIDGWTRPVAVPCPENPFTFPSTSLALDSSGNPRTTCVSVRAMYEDYLLYFASCDGDCDDSAHWNLDIARRLVNVPIYLVFPGAVSIFHSPSSQGLPRITYRDGDPRAGMATNYLHCEADCSNEANWGGAFISWKEDVAGKLDMKLNANGVPRFVASGEGFEYIVCADASCAEKTYTVFNNRYAEALALTRSDTPRVAVLDRKEGTNLAYASCDRACAVPTGWRFEDVITEDGPITSVNLALNVSQLPVVAYAQGNRLRYGVGQEDTGWGTASLLGVEASPSMQARNYVAMLVLPLAMAFVWRTLRRK